MVKFAPIFLLSLCSSLVLQSQINESDTSKFQVLARSGGSYQTGNIELVRMVSQLDFSSRLYENVVFKTQNNHLYQRIFGNKADEDLMSINYLYFRPERKVYPYAIGQISTNLRRGIDLRAFYGGGMTLQFLQKPSHTIKLSTNLLYEQSQFNNELYNYAEFNGSNQIRSLWSTLYLSGFHSLKETSLKVTYEFYWQQSLEDRVNYRYHVLAGFDQKLIEGLSIQSRFIYSFENVTTSVVKQNDLLWTWGLSYLFKSKKNKKTSI